MGEPADLSAVEARRLIGAKKLSPIELIASCLSRITATNGKINSVIAMGARRASDRADSREAHAFRRRRFSGLEGTATRRKHIVPVKGMRSTSCSLIFPEDIANADA